MQQASAADVIVVGRVRTQVAEAPVVDAVAIVDGVIAAVGGPEVLSWRGPRTEMVETGGGALLPGFVDAHIHAVMGGVGRAACDLSDVHSIAEYRSLISAYAQSHDELWVEGSGWYGDLFPGGFPTKDLLDEILPDRPAAFVSHDVHSLWVNSRALELAGITRDTPDPEGGRICRGPDGEPSGQIMEHAIALFDAVRPAIDDRRMREGLLRAQEYLHSLGVTAWQDAIVGPVFGYPDIYDAYTSADDEALLLSHVTGALLWDGQEDPAPFIARRDRTSRRFRATAAKIILDGNCENLTAAVHESYMGHPHEHGMLQFSVDQLNQGVRMLADAGLDIHIHAVGDLAVTRSVDALAQVIVDVDHRHQIAHIDLVCASDIERMSGLGIIANVSPLWARRDPVLVETKLPLLTPSQQERHFAYGSLSRAGIPVAFGSDWPVSTPDPIAGLHTAVNRTAAPDDPHAMDHRSRHEPLLPHERMTLAAALDAYTTQAARACRLEGRVGSVAVGKEADLVLLDRDPFDVEPDEIGTIRVERTFVRGDTVFAH